MKCLPTLFAALVLLPVTVFGQDSTAKGNATPFRKGQWAAQFQAGTAFGSLIHQVPITDPRTRARFAYRRLAFRSDPDRQQRGKTIRGVRIGGVHAGAVRVATISRGRDRGEGRLALFVRRARRLRAPRRGSAWRILAIQRMDGRSLR